MDALINRFSAATIADDRILVGVTAMFRTGAVHLFDIYALMNWSCADILPLIGPFSRFPIIGRDFASARMSALIRDVIHAKNNIVLAIAATALNTFALDAYAHYNSVATCGENIFECARIVATLVCLVAAYNSTAQEPIHATYLGTLAHTYLSVTTLDSREMRDALEIIYST